MRGIIICAVNLKGEEEMDEDEVKMLHCTNTETSARRERKIIGKFGAELCLVELSLHEFSCQCVCE